MDITVSVNVPPEIERQLQGSRSTLTAVAREAVVIDLFRQGIITHFQLRAPGQNSGTVTILAPQNGDCPPAFEFCPDALSQALGLDRFEADALLKRHQVTERGLTHAEIDADVRSISELIGPREPEDHQAVRSNNR